MKNIVIIGAGDLGKELVWLIEDINKERPTYVILGFLDDDISKTDKEFFGYKVLGTTKQLTELASRQAVRAVIAIQSGEIRKRIVEENKEFNNWETIIHPTAVIADSASLGKGNVFFPQAAVSVDSKLGSFGLYYLHASVGNDCIVGDYVSIMLNTSISEHAEIDGLSYIGADKHLPAHTRYGNNKMKKLVLIGAGGFGREVAGIVESINKKNPTYELVGFLDDGEQYHEGIFISDYPWLGNHEWAINHKEDTFFCCVIANVHIRAAIQKALMSQGVQFETIIANSAVVSKRAIIGQGCIIYGGVHVSVDCVLGNGVLLNTFTTIGHDVEIGDYTTISPGTGVSGACKIGSEVTIGGHSYLIPGKKVGNNATIAAGSVVFTNVKEGITVLGNPAKRMKGIED